MIDFEKKIHEACMRALKLTLIIGKEPGTKTDNGFYEIDDTIQPNRCTPLEAVVLGEDSHGVLVNDAAWVLGVSVEFILGWQAGYNFKVSMRNP